MITVDQGLSLACVLFSGGSLAVLLRVQKSFGAYTERIERSNEGTRRSDELTRQSNARNAVRMDDLRLDNEHTRTDNDFTREASIAALTELLDEMKRLKGERDKHPRSA